MPSSVSIAATAVGEMDVSPAADLEQVRGMIGKLESPNIPADWCFVDCELTLASWCSCLSGSRANADHMPRPLCAQRARRSASSGWTALRSTCTTSWTSRESSCSSWKRWAMSPRRQQSKTFRERRRKRHPRMSRKKFCRPRTISRRRTGRRQTRSPTTPR